MSASIHLFPEATIRPLAALGLTHPFWSLNSEILVATWIGMLLIFGFAWLGRSYLTKEFHPITIAYEKLISVFVSLGNDSFGTFHFDYFVFICTIFTFTFFSCAVGVIPFVEEATKDFNTTLAIALTSFGYLQYQKVKLHGVSGFLREFIEPIFVLAPLHLVGEVSKISSMSLRLFGNILGGSIIIHLIFQVLERFQNYFTPLAFITIGLSIIFTFVLSRPKNSLLAMASRSVNTLLNILFMVAWLQIFLGIFEGLIQSFVLTMLTTTYLAMNLAHETHTATHEKPS